MVGNEGKVEAELLVDALVDVVPRNGTRVNDVDECGVLGLGHDDVQPYTGNGVHGEPRDGLRNKDSQDHK